MNKFGESRISNFVEFLNSFPSQSRLSIVERGAAGLLFASREDWWHRDNAESYEELY